MKARRFHPSRTDTSLTKTPKRDGAMGNQLFLLNQETLPIYFCMKIPLHGRVLPGEGVQGPPKSQIPPVPGAPPRTKARGSFPWMLPAIHPRPQISSGGTSGSPPWHQELFLPRESLAGCQNNKSAGNWGALGSPQTFPEILLAFPCCLRPRGCWPPFAGNTPGGQREETGGALQPNPHSSLLLPSAGCGGGGMEACPAFGERTKGGEKRRAAAIPRAARGGRRGGRIHSSPAGPCAGG